MIKSDEQVGAPNVCGAQRVRSEVGGHIEVRAWVSAGKRHRDQRPGVGRDAWLLPECVKGQCVQLRLWTLMVPARKRDGMALVARRTAFTKEQPVEEQGRLVPHQGRAVSS